MKRFTTVILTFLLFSGSVSYAQVAINTDDSQPDASAMLDVKSTTQGFLPPRMTTLQRETISSPATGLTIYNTDSTCLEFWNGSAWFDICTGNSYTPPIAVEGGCPGAFWMDRNLGASQVATSSTDAASYGDLYQWGRAADGHEKIFRVAGDDPTSGTTTTLSSSDTPGHSNYIVNGSSSPYDWRSPQNNNLWQGVSGTNNPCPLGYRLPTYTEMDCERASWGGNQNSAGAYASPLKLPVAGSRGSSGSLGLVGFFGHYWSSTVFDVYARSLEFYSSNATMIPTNRVLGFSLRCLKD